MTMGDVLTKHHGLGNDFLVALVDQVPDDGAERARRWCDRHTGVGADGLIYGTGFDGEGPVRFTLFNSDGSPAEVSGNGLRCFAQAIARHRGVTRLDLEVDTPAGGRRVTIPGGGGATTIDAAVEMGAVGAGSPVPDDLVTLLADQGRALDGLAELRRWTSLDLGNPHVVFDAARSGVVAIDRFGPAVEALLGPINVEVIEVTDRQHVDMVVWERGAGATQACGSGACAAAVAAHRWDLVDDVVTVAMPGGTATVTIGGDGVVLTGPATYVARVEVADD